MNIWHLLLLSFYIIQFHLYNILKLLNSIFETYNPTSTKTKLLNMPIHNFRRNYFDTFYLLLKTQVQNILWLSSILIYQSGTANYLFYSESFLLLLPDNSVQVLHNMMLSYLFHMLDREIVKHPHADEIIDLLQYSANNMLFPDCPLFHMIQPLTNYRLHC